jgi:hypothetical protein
MLIPSGTSSTVRNLLWNYGVRGRKMSATRRTTSWKQATRSVSDRRSVYALTPDVINTAMTKISRRKQQIRKASKSSLFKTVLITNYSRANLSRVSITCFCKDSSGTPILKRWTKDRPLIARRITVAIAESSPLASIYRCQSAKFS